MQVSINMYRLILACIYSNIGIYLYICLLYLVRTCTDKQATGHYRYSRIVDI